MYTLQSNQLHHVCTDNPLSEVGSGLGKLVVMASSIATVPCWGVEHLGMVWSS